MERLKIWELKLFIKNMIKKHSKRYKTIQEITTKKKVYSIDESMKILQSIVTSKFNETIEAHISLNINPKNNSHQIRSIVDLPYGNGKNRRIAILTDSNNSSELIKSGASIVGFNNLLEDIKNGIIDFDILLTSRQFMPKLTILGKILGPKNLMPSPKFGTVTEDFCTTLSQIKKGRIEYRTDKTGIIHVGIAKSNFSSNEIKENLLTLYNSIEKNKPSGIKGKFFKSLYLCSTMSPSIKIDLQKIRENFS